MTTSRMGASKQKKNQSIASVLSQLRYALLDSTAGIDYCPGGGRRGKGGGTEKLNEKPFSKAEAFYIQARLLLPDYGASDYPIYGVHNLKHYLSILFIPLRESIQSARHRLFIPTRLFRRRS